MKAALISYASRHFKLVTMHISKNSLKVQFFGIDNLTTVYITLAMAQKYTEQLQIRDSVGKSSVEYLNNILIYMYMSN